ncbi:hypothetical protein EKD02_08595 [Chlorobium phaeovibrioides]|uniref:Uncharacterized protein n=1 Tax=Chlorobium phaeovibrioides TaxID=1094 RepID=A0A432ASR0_CHLPH|nr:TIGR04326 family surface carbohydrate biosynthesis protein [Chlorobium phaeovibrioides]RTY35989.1 hypothetical protein EKD02_08595 [Chlorobium phaeovibrioides]
MKDNVLYIWDAEGAPQQPIGRLVLWRSYGEDSCPEAISIPQWIEENADSLRARYLAWVYELGQVKVQGRRLVDFLDIRPGFSYWWMAPIAEKCNFSKSPHITDAVRLMALGDWAAGTSFSEIVLVSENRSLSKCLASWASHKGCKFRWKKIPPKRTQHSLSKNIFKWLPNPVQGILSLTRYLFQRWPLKGAGLSEWLGAKGEMTFISYLFNLDPVGLAEGRYKSSYWAHLPDKLSEDGQAVNWLHLYVIDKNLPSARFAGAAIRSFNGKSENGQVHATLDSFLGLGVVLHVILDWLRLCLKWPGVRGLLSSTPLGECDVSPLFEQEWRASFLGTTAVLSTLYHNMIEAAINSLPVRQRCGVYLQENQGWESSLLQIWGVTGNASLIGVPHSTVRYWDLRYFFDPRSYSRKLTNELPMPYRVACNGDAAIGAYKRGGYPVHELVKVEALRYLYLAEAKPRSVQTHGFMTSGLRVLVMGDYLHSNTHLQMRLLEKAFPLLPIGTRIIVKPHPNCPINPEDYPELSMELVEGSLGELLAECDVAYSSATTSAAVDAYCMLKPVVSVLDPYGLNLSPLRGCAGAFFASTPDELASKLVSATKLPVHSSIRNEFFSLDPQLPRWKTLLCN